MEGQDVLTKFLESITATNKRVSYFMNLAFALLLSIVILFSFIMYNSNKNYNETIEAIEKSNKETITEMTRLYFETDYLYPEQSIEQNQTIGDIN